MQRGSGDGGGGRRTGLRKVKAQITIVRGSPNLVALMKFKGLLRYQKPHVTDNISIYAFAYNVQYADSLYCCLYLNIRHNIQCRITNFLHCERSLVNLIGSPDFTWSSCTNNFTEKSGTARHIVHRNDIHGYQMTFTGTKFNYEYREQ